MSEQSKDHISEILKQPLTKYEALKLAALITPDMDKKHKEMAEYHGKIDQWEMNQFGKQGKSEPEIEKEYLGVLYQLAVSILEKDAEIIQNQQTQVSE